MFDLEKIAKPGVDENASSFVTQIQDIDLDKLLKYDHRVFGTPRDKLMTRWINTPGSFGCMGRNRPQQQHNRLL